MDYLQILIYFAIAYLFGSFPSAYLLLKLFSKKDIREQGSGNVGAMNALRTSKSKSIALIVLILDVAKGAIPAWYVLYHTNLPEHLQIIVLSALLIGHVFPVWLKFKGGRGLAVAAGTLGVVSYWIVVIWLVIWLLFFIVLKRHIVASIIATVLVPVTIYFTKDIYFSDQILLYSLVFCFLIFQRHLERLPDLVEEKRLKIQNGAVK